MPARFERDQDSIFSAAFSLNINQKMMKKIEKVGHCLMTLLSYICFDFKDYLTMKSKKTEDEMEIKVDSKLMHVSPVD